MISSSSVVVIAYDAVSPVGIDLETQWQRVLKGQSGIGPLTRFELSHDFPVRIAGEVESIDHLPYPFLKARENARWPSPVFKYALLTVQRAMDRSGIRITPHLAPRVAVTYSSAVGGLDTVLAADRKLREKGKLPAPCVNPNACINMVGGKVAMLTGATGPICSTITACATGLTSIIMGASFIQQGRADIAICGAVDFALVEPIVAGFATMNGAYMPKTVESEELPTTASRPFSFHRRGFVISEGAGCIILASSAFAKNHGFPYHCEIAGWAMTSDAHHFVAPLFDTVRRCIIESIYDAGIQPCDIDIINAHAAATRIGDKIEYDALRDVFHQRIPPITANKSMIGHCMGASSAIETIFALKSMEQQILLPTINYLPDPDISIDLTTDSACSLNQQYMLKNSFGFGGCNVCVVFRKTY